MKSTIKLFILIFLSFSKVNAQIIPLRGIYNIDSCNFESACQYIGFSSDSNNIWQLGKPNKLFFDSAYSGTNAIVTDTSNSYPSTNHSYFDIKIPSKIFFKNCVISFKHKFETDSLKDGGYIDISYDNGKNWFNVIDEHPIFNPGWFRTENMYSNSYYSLQNKKMGFSGKSNGWVYSRIEWIWSILLKKDPDTVILRFNFISDSIQTNKAGWMIDDFMISGLNQGDNVNTASENATYFEISPNPINENSKIHLTGISVTNCTISVLNILGQTVKNIEITNQEALLTNEMMKPGIYFVQLKNEDQVLETKKIVVE